MKYLNLIAAALVGCLCAFSVAKCHSDRQSSELEQVKQNLRASQDSVRYYQLKNGDLLAAKASWILDKNSLESQLGLARGTITDLEKKLHDVVTSVGHTQVITKVDTLVLESDPVYITTDSAHINFGYSDDWLVLSGDVQYRAPEVTTHLNSLEMYTPLTVGFTKNKQFFVSTPNPYVHITSIESGEIEKYVPKKKRWGLGLNIGPGLYYDFNSKNIGYGLGIQAGLNFNF